MMTENMTDYDINEQEIKDYCKKYGYKFRYFGENAIILTGMDTWRIKRVYKRDERRQLMIEHANTMGNRKGKMQFHNQRFAPDIAYVFDVVISRHEAYGGVYTKAFRIKELLATL